MRKYHAHYTYNHQIPDLPSLTFLDLSQTTLGDALFCKFIEKSPNLRKLKVSYYNNMLGNLEKVLPWAISQSKKLVILKIDLSGINYISEKEYHKIFGNIIPEHVKVILTR